MINAMSLRKTLAVLAVIVLIGAVLRFWGLGNNPFNADEFLDINSAYGYAQTGEWKAWDFNFGQPSEVNINQARDERANVYKWQVAQLFSFLPPTEAVARSVSALWGVFSILAMFFAGWMFSGKKRIGLFAAALFAVSVSGIEFDRKLRMYAMFFPLFLLMSVSLFGLYEREYKGKIQALRTFWEKTDLNPAYLLPLLVSGYLSFQTHQLSINIIPIFAVYVVTMIVLAWRRKRSAEDKYMGTAALGLVVAIVAWTAAPEKMKELLGALVLFDNHYSYFRYVVRDYAQPILAALLFGYGAWHLVKKLGKEKETAWLLVSSLVPLVMAVWFWRRNEGQQYIFFAQSFMAILVASGGYGLVRFVNDEFSSRWKHAVCAATLLLAVLVPNWGYFFWENNTYHETSTGSSANYRKIYQYFRNNAGDGDALIARNFRNYYWSGTETKVLDFGGELSVSKLSVGEIEAFMTKHPTGWFIASDNDMDYVSRDAEIFIGKNMERQSHSLIRGNVEVWRWGKNSL
jgi:hypothetical protein